MTDCFGPGLNRPINRIDMCVEKLVDPLFLGSGL
jgi:hypothetical protein